MISKLQIWLDILSKYFLSDIDLNLEISDLQQSKSSGFLFKTRSNFTLSICRRSNQEKRMSIQKMLRFTWKEHLSPDYKTLMSKFEIQYLALSSHLFRPWKTMLLIWTLFRPFFYLLSLNPTLKFKKLLSPHLPIYWRIQKSWKKCSLSLWFDLGRNFKRHQWFPTKMEAWVWRF